MKAIHLTLSNDPISYLASILTEKGYKVKENGKIRGISGVEHTFDIIAFKRHEVLCIDTITTREDFDLKALCTYVKAVDLRKISRVVLVAESSSIPEKLKSGNDIRATLRDGALKFIEFSSLEDLRNKIVSLLEKQPP